MNAVKFISNHFLIVQPDGPMRQRIEMPRTGLIQFPPAAVAQLRGTVRPRRGTRSVAPSVTDSAESSEILTEKGVDTCFSESGSSRRSDYHRIIEYIDWKTTELLLSKQQKTPISILHMPRRGPFLPDKAQIHLRAVQTHL